MESNIQMSDSDLPFRNFNCDNCGACCSAFIVEADYLDATREPKIYQIDPSISPGQLRNDGLCIVLWDEKARACPMLTDGLKPGTKFCSIYPTRPSDCVLVEAGDAKCQQARMQKGLKPLLDCDGNSVSRLDLADSIDLYQLETLREELVDFIKGS